MVNKLGLSVVFFATLLLFGCVGATRTDTTAAEEPALVVETRPESAALPPQQPPQSSAVSDTTGRRAAVTGDPQPHDSRQAVENPATASTGAESEVPPASRSPKTIDPVFVRTLKASLQQQGLLAAEGRYRLAIERLDIEQPRFGLDMTVVARVDYILLDANTGATVFKETVVASHTATVRDALAGTVRLRLAHAAATRRNIAGLVEKLLEFNIGAGAVSVDN
ncbi:hypothetical protein FKG94_22875 [Exilibacterium tricleocarpae]|uniref:Lipoprotein n=1 Tax=Exilibacterium tricleocarpae TaxID=2591008 RepID=A0A545SXE9_9GAMM|nr:hypothetical protein [Exilibacterium tricleocarpae]TQV69640.1 hypothetical protein FKG94_22875 [Exilibacterium tricleocarpae]